MLTKWLLSENVTTNTSAKIVVIGDIMLDRYWFGDAKRISPEAPVPVVNIKNQEDRLGGAANVAVNLRALEIETSLVGIVGADQEAAILRRLCQDQGIKTHFVSDDQHPTISKLRVISRHQHMLRMDFEVLSPHASTIQTQMQINSFLAIDEADIVILSDYGKGALQDIPALIAYAKAQNKPILIDPKGHSFDKYRGANLMTPNRSEFEMIVGICHTESELLEKAESLRQALNLDAILITRSEQGMTLIETNQAPLTFPAQAKDVFDVTGAGDTVVALIATGLLNGASLSEAVQLSNVGASIVVGKLGASSVTKAELKAHQTIRAHHLVLTKEALKLEVDRAKALGETIVMTNGCFDLLHRGHVTYLEQARRLGHRLIVALNSDASVKALKGAQRPIMDELSRSAVLASLSSVDWVVIFEEETPEMLINMLLPDVLVKGGDYTVEMIAGAKAVIDNGGSVQILELVDGYSTSNAVDKIRHH